MADSATLLELGAGLLRAVRVGCAGLPAAAGGHASRAPAQGA